MQKKKKTDLFRFVTLRSPQILTKAREDLGFIFHPAPSGSYFVADISDTTSVEEARLLLKNKANTYTPEVSVESIKEMSPELWDFSLWLMLNRNGITRAKLDALTLPTVFTMGFQHKLWNELYYDAIKRVNPNIREACLQLIVAVNFLQKFENYSNAATTDEAELEKEQKELLRLANGKVILHQGVTKGKTAAAATVYNGYYSNRILSLRHQSQVAAMRVRELEGLKSELLDVEFTHANERAVAHKSAKETLAASNKTKLVDFKNRNAALFNQSEERVERIVKTKSDSNAQSDFSEEEEKYAKVKPSNESIIPDDLLDELQFDFPKPLSTSFTQNKLSNSATKFVAKNRLETSDVKKAVSLVNKELKAAKKIARRSIRKRPLEFLVNGISTKTSESRDVDCSMSLNVFENEASRTVYTLYITIDAGYNNALLNGLSLTYTCGSYTDVYTEAKVISNEDDILFLEIAFEDPIQHPFAGLMFSLNGTFELNNGRDFTISMSGNAESSATCTKARYVVANDAGADQHYGINKIGVADFRRVEQELCCYVPGEVSNIENIMAREYKEKSVRKFTRTQTSTETKSEEEVENESESTSTDRFEMSSEVANVIDKDRNFSVGFDASAHGGNKTYGFNAGTSGDLSFGQSTSKSDTQSKNYAEDITRRALERITQKVSRKRTSKVVQEQEERANHGFDNRQGDQHVTGVYRWIDKVYKNRIVNYGKRLIYEFMIPEPSKFYKEAIIIKAEEESSTNYDRKGEVGTESLIAKPIHPSAYMILNALSIKRDNYASLVALYGLKVDAPKDQYTTVVGMEAIAYGGDDPEKSVINKELAVPQDYQAFFLEGKVNYRYKSTSSHFGSLAVNVAGEVVARGFGDNYGADFIHIDQPLHFVEGSLPFSVVSKKMTMVNLSARVKCVLKRSVYEQWQQDVYGAIIEEYESQLKMYNDAQREAAEEAAAARAILEGNKPVDTVLKSHPKFNAEIVKNELKRLCIEMLLAPFGHEQGKGFYENGRDEIPQLELGEDLDAYASQVKFFEQAFDWDIMAQKFYPYYWAKRSDWKSLFQAQDGLDYIFQAFLQSGMSRVMIPVREGFEDAVTYYMETGDIWNGSGLVVNTDDKLYLSIVDEVTDVAGIVEGSEWETIVPTSLEVLQHKSVSLLEGGLPCCSHEAADTNLYPDTNILNVETPPPTPEP